MKLVAASPLQAFAAGAALSATSLGTTFTILSSTNLIMTRLGIVATSAAMLDDVIGLAMVQVISDLGESSVSRESIDIVTIARPILVSVGFVLALLIGCRYLLRPLIKRLISVKNPMLRCMGTVEFIFLIQTCYLLALITGATFAGTSNLLASYLAGATTSWADGLVNVEGRQSSETPGLAATEMNTEPGPSAIEGGPGRMTIRTNAVSEAQQGPLGSQQVSSRMPRYIGGTSPPLQRDIPTCMLVFRRYYEQPTRRLLIPLFFVSLFPLQLFALC